MTFAKRVIDFNKNLNFVGRLPNGIRIMNPFAENPDVLRISAEFYEKYYDDNKLRKLILGINPGRLGAGATGIPFTDTKRLEDYCGISVNTFSTHEPSSVFVYKVIDLFGGTEKFYAKYYINSICPLGFLSKNPKGNWINYNYYDAEHLFRKVKSFMISSLREQLNFGINTDVCYVLGRKNATYINKLNQQHNFFKSIEVLDHPRFVVQYKSKQMDFYLSDYLRVLSA